MISPLLLFWVSVFVQGPLSACVSSYLTHITTIPLVFPVMENNHIWIHVHLVYQHDLGLSPQTYLFPMAEKKLIHAFKEEALLQHSLWHFGLYFFPNTLLNWGGQNYVTATQLWWSPYFVANNLTKTKFQLDLSIFMTHLNHNSAEN